MYDVDISCDADIIMLPPPVNDTEPESSFKVAIFAAASPPIYILIKFTPNPAAMKEPSLDTRIVVKDDAFVAEYVSLFHVAP